LKTSLLFLSYFKSLANFYSFVSTMAAKKGDIMYAGKGKEAKLIMVSAAMVGERNGNNNQGQVNWEDNEEDNEEGNGGGNAGNGGANGGNGGNNAGPPPPPTNTPEG
jgi:hypothetical protein